MSRTFLDWSNTRAVKTLDEEVFLLVFRDALLGNESLSSLQEYSSIASGG